jgi:hypothetical protein
MTDQTAQEPTMEEILASIRRIISEDDAPAETAAAPAPAAQAAAAPEPEPEVSPALMDETPSMQEPAASEDDVLELTDRYQAPVSQSIGDLDVTDSAPEPFPMAVEAAAPPSVSAYAPEPEPAYEPAPARGGYDGLVGDTAAASAASAFAGLAASFKKPDPLETSGGGSGPTVDELARQLLRPMLKDWLDTNLPAIVEAAVRKEVERIARSAG